MAAPMPPPLAAVSKSEYDKDPSARFWALVDYLGRNNVPQADRQLEVVRLAYFYDAEVLNGGHLQYFINRGTNEAPAVLTALEALGDLERAALLRSCLAKATARPLPEIKSLDAYADLARERSFRLEDTRYYELQPELLQRIQDFIAGKLPELVEVREDAV